MDIKKFAGMRTSDQVIFIADFIKNGGSFISKRGSFLIKHGGYMALRFSAKDDPKVLKSFMEVVINEPLSSFSRRRVMEIFNWFPRNLKIKKKRL